MKYVNLSATIGEINGVISPQDYLDKLPELRGAARGCRGLRH